MNNQPPKQLMVIPGAVANQNQHTTPVALLDEAGNPLTLQQDSFDFGDFDEDPAAWYDTEALILPPGSYQLRVAGAFSGGTAATDNWTVALTLVEAGEATTLSIPSQVITGTPGLGMKNVIHLFAPTTVSGRVARNGTVSAYLTVDISIQKL